MSDENNEDPQAANGTGVNRRSFLERVIGGAALIGVGGAAIMPTVAHAQVNDEDPVDPANHGRGRPNARRTGLNDDDPVDNAGWGRGSGGSSGGGRSGLDDADPADEAGNGRGRPNARRTGLNDDDPVDNAGWGRGGR